MTFTDQDLIVLLVLAAAATLIDLALPQRPRRGWNSTRAATQRDVADVLRGGQQQRQPSLLPPLLLLVVVLALAWWLAG